MLGLFCLLPIAAYADSYGPSQTISERMHDSNVATFARWVSSERNPNERQRFGYPIPGTTRFEIVETLHDRREPTEQTVLVDWPYFSEGEPGDLFLLLAEEASGSLVVVSHRGHQRGAA